MFGNLCDSTGFPACRAFPCRDGRAGDHCFAAGSGGGSPHIEKQINARPRAGGFGDDRLLQPSIFDLPGIEQDF